MTPGSSSTPMQDADTADAVIEHRVVLGQAGEAIVLLQAGVPIARSSFVIHVVAGTAVAVDGTEVTCDGHDLAESAAEPLFAGARGDRAVSRR